MRFVWPLFVLFPAYLSAQSGERIESEYKLDVKVEESTSLWRFIQSESFLDEISQDRSLKVLVSEEDFVDVYFDNDQSVLFSQKVGLRFRSRYKNDTLLKQLVQLKTPINKDGVARNEIKYELKKSTDKNDFYARHDLLKYIKKRDREDLNYQLNKFNVRSDQVTKTHTLLQNRKRVYIHDDIGALATLTLDKVDNAQFPFQTYTELELELNEVRYTEANWQEKEMMEKFNALLKKKLKEEFPNLQQDQTPKYNKMKNLIDQSKLSWVYKNRMWLILGGLMLFALYLWIRNEN